MIECNYAVQQMNLKCMLPEDFRFYKVDHVILD